MRATVDLLLLDRVAERLGHTADPGGKGFDAGPSGCDPDPDSLPLKSRNFRLLTLTQKT